MPLELVKTALESRTVRKAIGTRVISALETKEAKDDRGGIIGFILDWGSRAIGFLYTKVIGIVGRNLNFSNAWSMVVSTATFLLTFNFNTTDEELDQQVKQYELAIYSQLGSTAGSAVGYFACGFLPGISLLAVNEMMAAKALRDVGEEFVEEFSANLSGLIQAKFRAESFKTFANAYKNIRRWLKKPNNLAAQIIFGDRYADVMKVWGEKGSKPFTFAEKIEEYVEKIPNEKLRVFLESFLEELVDACIEAGYVVANSMDSFIAANKMQNNNLMGEKRIVEIRPNRETEETILLSGPEELLKPQIVSTIANHQLIANRDVGQIVGYDAAENVRAKPQLRRIVIKLHNFQEPPFIRNGQRRQPVSIKIPDVPRSNMDWQKIRTVLGDTKGYTWGRFLATLELDNGRQLQVYGGSENEAEKIAYSCATLSSANVLSCNVSEQKKSGVRLAKPQLQKESCIVYPSFVTIFVYKRDTEGRTNREGTTLKEESVRLDLWGSQKPVEWDEQIQQLFSGDTE